MHSWGFSIAVLKELTIPTVSDLPENTHKWIKETIESDVLIRLFVEE